MFNPYSSVLLEMGINVFVRRMSKQTSEERELCYFSHMKWRMHGSSEQRWMKACIESHPTERGKDYHYVLRASRLTASISLIECWNEMKDCD